MYFKGMSGWNAAELEDIGWDVFGRSDDHIVPYQGIELLAETSVPGGAQKKLWHELKNDDGKNMCSTGFSANSVLSVEDTTYPQNGRPPILSGSQAHTFNVVVPTLHDIESTSSTIVLPSHDVRILDSCLNESISIAKRKLPFSRDPSLGITVSINKSKSCLSSFNGLSPDVTGLSSLENSKKARDNDLAYYDLPDISNFAGSDLVANEPADFVPEPDGFLPKVENPEVRAWALEVHSLWMNLSRRVSDDVKENPDLHTLLPLPEPVVVPGSRFKEVYYWDSYWTIRGLLVSKMYDTAKSIVRNLVSLIDVYGHVLNGARVYYSNRSQPPLLSAMVFEIYMKTMDLAFVNESLPALLKEHNFWNSGIHNVTIQDLQGQKHCLSRYYAMWNKPRPESATIDEEMGSKLPTFQKESFYREVASTAESGWDFSSRWMRNSPDMTTLATTSIIPVDLNVYIYKMELDISFFAKLIGDKCTSEKFLAASKARLNAMRSVFWNDEMGQWLDYWLIGKNSCEEVNQWNAHNQNRNIYASNFIPLWIQENNSDGPAVENVIKSLQTSGLLHAAGIATSLVNSGQQWDFQNGWPPLQHMIAEGLIRSNSLEARSLAEDIAVRWLRTNYAAYKKTGAMHEKYDVEACGEAGGGGEYQTQTGFGWSNGVVLAFLEEFGWPADRDIGCQK